MSENVWDRLENFAVSDDRFGVDTLADIYAAVLRGRALEWVAEAADRFYRLKGSRDPGLARDAGRAKRALGDALAAFRALNEQAPDTEGRA